jgi:hypothetical protein
MTQPTTTTPLVKILIQVSISLFGIVLACTVIEIGFRLFMPAPRPPAHDRPREYYIHEESRTFQDYPHATVKPEGVFRIAVIGDSFTFAPYMQFDDTFPKRMERYLNLNTNQRKVEVINYGVPAYSTSHEVPVAERAIKEGADFILFQITLNDPEIKPYTPTQLYRERNKFGELQLEHPIFKYWTTLAFALKRIHNRGTQHNYKQKFFDLFENEKTWNNFSTSWGKIREIMNTSQVPTAAVLFPLFGYPVSDAYPFWPLHKKVSLLMSTLQIPLLDVSSIYKDLPLDRLQVLPGKDFHPNEIAHRMASERILEWLKQEKKVPEDLFPKRAFPQRIGITLEKQVAPDL